MESFEKDIQVFRSCEAHPVSDFNTYEISLNKQSILTAEPKNIKGANFTKFENQNSKETIVDAYNNQYKLIYGSAIDKDLLKQINEEVNSSNRNFNYSLVLSEETTAVILNEILRRENLFSGTLLKAFIDDVTQDVKNYLSVTGENECVLRLVLEDYSSLYDLLYMKSNLSKCDIWQKVKDYIIGLGYHDSFVFHVDDYAINFSKVYCGAPSLCMNTNLDQLNRANYFDKWIECFNQPIDFHSALAESLFTKDKDKSIDLISQLVTNINNFQLNPSKVLEDAATYQFQLGAPHFYFGLENELNQESLLLHARPMIWARDVYAKRLLSLIEPTAKFDHETFFK